MKELAAVVTNGLGHEPTILSHSLIRHRSCGCLLCVIIFVGSADQLLQLVLINAALTHNADPMDELLMW